MKNDVGAGRQERKEEREEKAGPPRHLSRLSHQGPRIAVQAMGGELGEALEVDEQPAVLRSKGNKKEE